jgi:hypothetical protein
VGVLGLWWSLQVHVELPRFLDASLIQVDSHPTYITIVIKGKVLRLRFPEEVNSDAGTAKRSATTGDLVITLPRVARRAFGAGGGGGGRRVDGHAPPAAVGGSGLGAAASAPGSGADVGAGSGGGMGVAGGSGAGAGSGRVRRLQAPKKLGDALLEEASRVVSVADIVRPGEAHLTAVSTKLLGQGPVAAPAHAGARTHPVVGDGPQVDDSDVPPLE